MSTMNAERDRGELASLGQEVFERVVKPTLSMNDRWKYVAIALDSDDFAVAETSQQALSQVRERNPLGEVWIMRTDGTPAFRMRSAV